MKSNFYLNINISLLIKILFIISIIFQVKFYKKKLKQLYSDYNNKYEKLYKNLNLTFFNINKNKEINLAIYTLRMKDGGRARITALLINYLNEIKIFKIFLFTSYLIEEDEYKIPNNIKRLTIKLIF